MNLNHLRDQRATVRLGLAAAKRDGHAERIKWYQHCLDNVNQKLREARKG
jgi:hypothetical protein